jgi:acyl-CoA hydrolase
MHSTTPHTPIDPDIELKTKSVLAIIEKLERHIDESAFIPATNQHRGQVVLALFSKCLTVGRAVCCLVESGFGEEAFGLTRTLFDIHFYVRYISNNDTEARAQRYVEFFAKDREGWRTVIPKYFPNMQMSASQEQKEVVEMAKNYKNPHDWSGEPHKTRSLAEEPDTYEFDSDDKPITALVDYELFYKMTSRRYAELKATSLPDMTPSAFEQTATPPATQTSR